MYNNYLVEYIGTLFFIFTILYTGSAIAIGLALTIAIILGGKVSRSTNFNPAVTVVMAYAGKLPMKDVLPYIISQIAGGVTALFLYKKIV